MDEGGVVVVSELEWCLWLWNGDCYSIFMTLMVPLFGLAEIVVKFFWVSVLGLHFDKARDVCCKFIRALGLHAESFVLQFESFGSLFF